MFESRSHEALHEKPLYSIIAQLDGVGTSNDFMLNSEQWWTCSRVIFPSSSLKLEREHEDYVRGPFLGSEGAYAQERAACRSKQTRSCHTARKAIRCRRLDRGDCPLAPVEAIFSDPVCL